MCFFSVLLANPSIISPCAINASLLLHAPQHFDVIEEVL